MVALPFTFLLHAHWSTSPAKRWAALASRRDRGWSVGGPFQVSSSDELLRGLFATAKHAPVLAGFDFPIGVPAAYGRRTGLPNFVAGLEAFGSGRWEHFYDVADNPFELSVERPFYPRRSTKEAKQRISLQHLGRPRSTISGGNVSGRPPIAPRPALCFGRWEATR
jgi:hypothetical protein